MHRTKKTVVCRYVAILFRCVPPDMAVIADGHALCAPSVRERRSTAAKVPYNIEWQWLVARSDTLIAHGLW
jgi:phosphatidylserine decarboxylase